MSSPHVAPIRVTFAKITRILAMTTGTLVVVQFALAGFGAFDAFQKQHGFKPHEVLGDIIGGFTVLVLIAAFIARANNRMLIQASLLFIMAAPLQQVLASVGKDHPWVGAIHALVGVFILGATFGLSLKSTAHFGIPVGRGATSTDSTTS